MNVIEAKRLVRFYGGIRGVAGLTMQVPKGSVFGLLGENASGKTTALRLAMGQLVPNHGSIRVWGVDPLEMPASTRARIAYVADEMELPPWMKIREGMALYASYFPSWSQDDANRLIERFGLDLDRRYATMSKGQKRKFFLLLALAQRPELLVLDEPAGGLDTAVRREFLDLLLDLANTREVTILLSSHILSDMERIVDRVAFIKEGRLLLQEELEELKGKVKRLSLPDSAPSGAVKERFEVLSTFEAAGVWQAVVTDFEEHKLEGLDVTVEHMNLEELFLAFNERGHIKRARA